MRAKLLAGLLIGTLLASAPAWAAEPVPGGACATTNFIVETGGPETSGIRNILRCNGTTWQQEMTIDASGHVGIGTVTPDSQFQIYDANNPSANTTLMTIGKDLQTVGFGGSIDFRFTWYGATPYTPAKIMALDQSGFGGKLAFYTAPTGVGQGDVTVERMRIDDNGNVGIGTDTPLVQVQVQKNQNALTDMAVVNTDTGAAGEAGISVTSDTGTLVIGSHSAAFGYAPSASYIWSQSNTPLYFGTNGTERIRIAADGYVGIGTTAPTDRLSILQDTDYTSTSGGGGINIFVDAAYSRGLFIGADATHNVSFVQSYTSSWDSPLSFQPDGGSVGISKTTPNSKLDVNGYIEWNGQSRVTSTFSKANNTLAAITGLSATLEAGKTYYFDITLYTTAVAAANGIKADLNGGTATATAIVADGTVYTGAAVASTRATALNTTVCNSTTGTTNKCHITGTITVNAAGTFIPRFAESVTNASASTVAIGSTMIVQQIN